MVKDGSQQDGIFELGHLLPGSKVDPPDGGQWVIDGPWKNWKCKCLDFNQWWIGLVYMIRKRTSGIIYQAIENCEIITITIELGG